MVHPKQSKHSLKKNQSSQNIVLFPSCKHWTRLHKSLLCCLQAILRTQG
jgi:hypothetical protein